jgi:hypothetical protein
VKDEDDKGEDAQSDDAVFLKRVESNMLTELALRGIPDIKKVRGERGACSEAPQGSWEAASKPARRTARLLTAAPAPSCVEVRESGRHEALRTTRGRV